MELASQIFLSLNFEIEKLFDPFLISYIPLRKMGSTASSLFGLIFWNLALEEFHFHCVVRPCVVFYIF